MNPILFPPSATSYSTGGSGRLSDAISCAVTEELNGSYELELRYPANGIHAAEIAEGCQLYVAHDESGDRQPFRVYKKTDTIDGVFTIYARHISGDLSRIPVMPFTASGVSAALAGLASHAAVPCPFVFETEVTTGGGFALTVPTSAKAALGSGEGSILGVFGGEVEYDNRTVTLLSRRGTDTGVVIQYGKNMTGLEVVSEASTAYNAVVPFCKTQEGTVVCNPPVVYHGSTYTDAVPLDLSDAFDYVPSKTQLREAALAWLNEHQPWITERAINVSFVQLRQTAEYADFAPLERVLLGDSVTVRHTALGVNAQFRVIKTVYDALQDRYIDLTLGRETQTVATMISEMIAKIREARDIAQEIANGTYNGGTFISGNLIYSPSIYGGEISIGPQSGGYNFSVDSSGNVETNGSVHLLGGDTRIVAPTIFADRFAVLPEGIDPSDAPQTAPGFGLYAAFGQDIYHFFQVSFEDYLPPYVRLFSPSGAHIVIGRRGRPPSQTDYEGKHDFSDASVSGLEESGYVRNSDISDFVTASEVERMIDAALGGT